ncbi:hypothetical protein ABBQ32_006382 [Trebouxia sp. C0010 RCD-2024]
MSAQTSLWSDTSSSWSQAQIFQLPAYPVSHVSSVTSIQAVWIQAAPLVADWWQQSTAASGSEITVAVSAQSYYKQQLAESRGLWARPFALSQPEHVPSI